MFTEESNKFLSHCHLFLGLCVTSKYIHIRTKLTFSSSFRHLSICRTLVTDSVFGVFPLTIKHLLQDTTRKSNFPLDKTYATTFLKIRGLWKFAAVSFPLKLLGDSCRVESMDFQSTKKD